MEFEYDSAKSESNKSKHGIDFEAAKMLWQDGDAIEVPSDYFGEERYLVIGEIGHICWTAIITHREQMIRIISVRRSRTKEAQAYDYRKGIG
ncbi:MAG TPA: BrnT family toxin [Pyrinomonadaceae bacterium]|nr:BrnT family toxin [Pyrinomonadaceae bacterium]